VAPPVVADDPVRILGKGESQDQKFQKQYLKLIDEEPTRVMPDEMEKLVENFRAIVTLFKRNSDECMIARPCSSQIRNKSCLTLRLPF
jgi:ferredoxin-fold anticodon binding domain-containing protein